jgi:hypothetical protein
MSTAFIRATATPAPWKVAHSGYANSPFVIYSGDKAPDFSRRFPLSGIHAIAEVFHDESPDHEQQKADAALIGAAPELADLVMRMYQHVSHGGPTREEAEKVLRKAGLIL